MKWSQILDDFQTVQYRKRLLEKHVLSVSCRRRKVYSEFQTGNTGRCYIFRQGVPGRVSIQESLDTDG